MPVRVSGRRNCPGKWLVVAGWTLFGLTPLAMTGCSTCTPSCGWNFSVGRPSTMSMPMMISQSGVATYAAEGLSSAPGPIPAMTTYAGPAGPALVSTARLATAAVDPCAAYVQPRMAQSNFAAATDPCNDLTDICRRLDAQNATLQKLVQSLQGLQGPAIRATPAEKIPAPLPPGRNE